MARTITADSGAITLVSASDNPLSILGAVTVAGSSYGVSGGAGVDWTITNQGTVTASSGVGVSLTAGGTVTNSGTLSRIAGFTGVVASNSAATVINQGGIAGTATTGDGVILFAGGAVTNSGTAASISGGNVGVLASGSSAATIANEGTLAGGASGEGVLLLAGGTLTNSAAALIGAGHFGVLAKYSSATVTNDGSVIGTSTDGVALEACGVFANTSPSALVAGAVAGLYVDNGAATVTNLGTISAGASISIGAYLKAGGLVTNGTGAIISGGFEGVAVIGGTVALSNQGRVTGNSAFGVYLGLPGTVTNSGTAASIYGGQDGVKLLAGCAVTATGGASIYGKKYCVFVAAGAATIASQATISGKTGAVRFADADGNLLHLYPGAVTNGVVQGGTGANTLALGQGTAAGTISGIGSQFDGFGLVNVDAGAYWQAAGANTLGAAATVDLAPASTLDFTGVLVAPARVTIAGSGTLKIDGALSASDVLNQATISGADKALHFTAGGTVTNSGTASVIAGGTEGLDVAGGAATATNEGTISSANTAVGGAVYIFAGGTVTNSGTAAHIVGANQGIVFLSAAGSLTNQGTVSAGANAGALFTAGGALTNSGTAAVITGDNFGVGAFGSFSMTNQGTVSGGQVGVGASGNAVLTNSGTAARIFGGLTGVSVGTESGTITNQGTIASNSYGAALTSPSDRLTNDGIAASISGGKWGVGVAGNGAVITNQGSISGTSNGGVYFGTSASGTVINEGGAGISGGPWGIYAASSSGPSTVISQGTISGTTGAVHFSNTDGNLLHLYPGAVTNGIVQAGTGVDTLALDSSASIGTIAGIGSQFTLFNVIDVDTGAKWLAAGANTLDAIGNLYVAGSLAVTGSLIAPGNLTLAGNGFGTLMPTGGAIEVGGAGIAQPGQLVIDAGHTLVNNAFVAIPAIVNQGTITGPTVGAYVGAGETLTNSGTASLIAGSNSGVRIIGAGAVVTNQGSIAGTSSDGVYLFAGGTVSNSGTAASIVGGLSGIYAGNDPASIANRGIISTKGANGVYLKAGGTLTNAGTIIGATDAVLLAPGYANRLVIGPGAVFSGTVDGGNSYASSIVSTLELASAASQGVFPGLGGQFINFYQGMVDTDASWRITGNSQFKTLTNSGILDVAGTTLTSGALVNNGGISLDSTILSVQSLSGNGTVTIGSDATLDAAGTVASGETINLSASSSVLTVENPNVVAATITGIDRLSTINLANFGFIGGKTTATINSGGTLVVTNGKDTDSLLLGGPRPASLVVTADPAHGVDITAAPPRTLIWTGKTDNDFDTAANWDDQALAGTALFAPGATDSAKFTVGNGTITGNGTADLLSFDSNGEWHLGSGTSLTAVASTTMGGVTGASVFVTDGAQLADGGLLSVGGSTLVSLQIATGGSVTTDTMFISMGPSSSAVVSVEDPGSTLIVGSELDVGLFGSAELSILNGAIVSAQTAEVGRNTIATGTVDIEGKGSRLEVANDFNIARLGIGTVTLGNLTEITVGGTLNISATGVLNQSGGTVDPSAVNNSGRAGGAGAISATASVVNTGTLFAASGAETMTAPAITGTGVLRVDADGDLILNVGSIVTTQTVTFTAATGTLTIGSLAGFAATIGNFNAGDAILVPGATVATTNFDPATHVLTLFDKSATEVGTLQFGASVTNGSTISVNGVTPCFAAGTRVSTRRGEVPVEALRVGDMVQLLPAGCFAPVTWLGHRTVDCRRHPEPRKVRPVRVSAGAFGLGRPVWDLFLSPDHAIFVNDVLIPVKLLTNGTTIAQVAVDEVTYWHVELPRHAVLLADGLPAESYLDTGDRGNFANGGGPITLHPDFASRIWDAKGCAPLVVSGPQLVAARQSVHTRQNCRRRGARLRGTVRQCPEVDAAE